MTTAARPCAVDGVRVCRVSRSRVCYCSTLVLRPEMTAPVFRRSDRDNLELVRQIVLDQLKNDPEWHQFDYT